MRNIFVKNLHPDPVLSGAVKGGGSGIKAFSLDWKIQTNSGVWQRIGQTLHTVYITRTNPTTALRHETLFNLACRNAKNKGANEQEVVDAVFADFVKKNSESYPQVFRVVPSSGNLENQPMEYEHVASPVNDGSSSSLLKLQIGRCQNFAELFKDTLSIHGISSSLVELHPDDNLSLFNLFQQYRTAYQARFGNNPVDNSYAPVLLVKNWGIGDPWNPQDHAGIPAQGAANPQSAFRSHMVTQYNSKIYDPSYGSKTATYLEWENASLEAVGDFYTLPADPSLHYWIATANRNQSRETDEIVRP